MFDVLLEVRRPESLVSGQHLVLLGGGHAHLEVVRRFQNRPEGKITMISPQPASAYSGRLPAVVAGRLDSSQLWLPLQKLCLRAGIEYCQDSVESLHLEEKSVLCHSGRSVPFDLLSINVGSQPPGIFPGALPVRPLAPFLHQLEGLLSRCVGGDLAVVGGGAGGVELVLALRQRLLQERRKCRLHLVTVGSSLLSGHCQMAQSLCQTAVEQRGVEIHFGRWMSQPCQDFSALIWATGASAYPWLAQSGLATDADGFVSVHSNLQSLSHPWVFAAGDAASLQPSPCAKAGVFAVRQGPVLAQNLARRLEGKAARSCLPSYRRYLSLISYADGVALGSWGSLAAQGRPLHYLKDWIDERWMRRHA